VSRPPGRPRWLWPLLVTSLSANILLGAYAGTLFWRLQMPLIEATSPARVLERAASFLDGEDRAAAREAYLKREDAFTDSEGDVAAARARVIALLQAPVLDDAAIRAAFREVHAARSRSFDMLVDAVIETGAGDPARPPPRADVENPAALRGILA
jgi:uncharacterized membrane protein